jgi:hypothetical protein
MRGEEKKRAKEGENEKKMERVYEGAKGSMIIRVRDVRRACENESLMVLLLLYKEILMLFDDVRSSLPDSIVPLL